MSSLLKVVLDKVMKLLNQFNLSSQFTEKFLSVFSHTAEVMHPTNRFSSIFSKDFRTTLSLISVHFFDFLQRRFLNFPEEERQVSLRPLSQKLSNQEVLMNRDMQCLNLHLCLLLFRALIRRKDLMNYSQ